MCVTVNLHLIMRWSNRNHEAEKPLLSQHKQETGLMIMSVIICRSDHKKLLATAGNRPSLFLFDKNYSLLALGNCFFLRISESTFLTHFLRFRPSGGTSRAGKQWGMTSGLLLELIDSMRNIEQHRPVCCFTSKWINQPVLPDNSHFHYLMSYRC